MNTSKRLRVVNPEVLQPAEIYVLMAQGRYCDAEDEAYERLMVAADGLDRLGYRTGVEPWLAYNRAYSVWIGVRRWMERHQPSGRKEVASQ